VFIFSWRVTSLRARRSCLPGLRRGGGRQAGATVLSRLVWRCELAARTSAFCVEVRPAVALRHRPDAAVRRSGRLDSHRPITPDTTKQSSLRRVRRGGVN